MVLEDDEDGTIWLTHLCGNISLQDAFWSPAITINSTNPDFTTCFHNTALVWIPCVFLWLCFPFYMAYLSTQKYTHGTCDFSRMLVAKLVLGLLLLVCNVIQFFHICLWSDGPPAPWSAQIIYFSTLVLAQFLMKFEYSKGQQSSGTVFCFWLLMVIANVFTLRKYTQDAVQYGTFEDETLFTVYCVFFSLLCIQFVLHLFADVGALERTEIIYDTEIQPLLSKEVRRFTANPICPEPRASFLSRMTFMWTWRLLLDGYRKCLTGDRLYQLRPSETAEPIIEKFHKDWVKIGKNKGQFNTTETKMTQFSSLKNENGSRTWMTNSSIVMSCVRSFGLHYAAVGIFEVVNIVLTFIRPAILDALITFVTTTDKFTWRGYLYAFLLFIITILRSIFQQQHFFGKFLSGQRARSALICAVYRKTLLLAGSARKKFSVGEIVNFMAVDAQRVSDVTFTMHTIWSSIVQCIVAMVMLWGYLGPSSLGGLAVLVISIAINIFLAAQQKKLQRKAMKLKDKRIKLTNEILNGIKILKLYVWESAFQNKLKVIRDEELANIKKASFFATGVIISFTCAPILYTVVSFSLYILVAGNRALSAQVAFVSLSLVGALTRPLTFLPNGITSFVQAQVSVTRLQNFLNDEELNPNDISPNVTGSNVIEIDDGTFTWEGKEAQPILKDINLKIKRGSFTAIVGQVGSGKSTLLSAMLGELYKVEGSIRRWGRVAYVPQVAWIRNMTLKSNVLFQKSVHKDKYDQVIEACELVPDIKILPAGDMTEIGEKGINLSGGQKQRVSLARAVYQDMDIYLMDDPLSAVDAHVAKNLFAKVIGPKGMLAHKTRVLVTHSVTYLPQADHIITMKDGQISEMGTYDELLSNNGAFAELMKNYLNEIEMEEDLNEEDEKLKVELKRQFSDMSDAASDSSGMTEKSGSETPRRRRRGTRTSQIESDQAKLDSTNIDQAAKRIQDGKKLIEAETVQTGRIQLAVMKSYLTSLGLAATTIVLIAYVCQLTSDLGSTIWLSEWSLDEDRSINETVDPKIRVGVYGGIGAANTISVMVQAIVIAIACVTAAGSFHDRLMDRIVKAPVLFFETTPLGRILNRFSQDMNVVDSSIRNTIITCMRGISGMITTVIAISYTSPIFILIVIPLTVLYYLTQRFYVGSANQLRRLMNVRTSPIYSHFGESVAGATSIRAYKLQSSFEQDSEKLVDQMQMGRFPTLATNRWLSISLELLGAFVVLSAGLFAVVSRETITGGLVGLSVSYALQVTDRLALFVRNISDFENNVVALERIKEYSEIETEAPWEIEENRPREDWPNEGKVKFEQYSTRYRPGLDLVLEKINCSISASEKIGIVGRTGAGKSSMTVALFRIIEAVEGCIYIDDVGIGGIGLHDLRKKITIIPQDPVLFSGTIRFNLDPFNKHTDQEIWNALEQAHLKYFISSLPDQISHECTEGGSNLSVGQRQLVCLARALLRKTKILVLDEATAAVDLETDDLIQSTIRTEFSDCTVITIAHRLHTVLDNDRIIVMDSGSIKEFDTPDNLLQDSESTFYTMCKVAGILPQ